MRVFLKKVNGERLELALGQCIRVEFDMGDGVISVRLHNDVGVLRVSAEERLVIEPQASNAVFLRSRKF